VAKQAGAADLGFGPADRDSAEIEKTRAISDPGGPEMGDIQVCAGQSWGNQTGAELADDLIEFELAKALGKAADAGRFDVVAQLAKELEGRRVMRLAKVLAVDVRR
jgi:hypothetical protein